MICNVHCDWKKVRFGHRHSSSVSTFRYYYWSQGWQIRTRHPRHSFVSSPASALVGSDRGSGPNLQRYFGVRVHCSRSNSGWSEEGTGTDDSNHHSPASSCYPAHDHREAEQGVASATPWKSWAARAASYASCCLWQLLSRRLTILSSSADPSSPHTSFGRSLRGPWRQMQRLH